MNRIPKLYAIACLALALLLAVSTPVLANEVQGTLVAIDHDDFTFTVTDNQGATHEFQLRVDGNVLINDEERSFWDLVVGDQLNVTYETDSLYRMIATEIRCTRD
jgi:hypothetical protein